MIGFIHRAMRFGLLSGSCELVNDSGARINLIYNARTRKDGSNVLLDIPEKWPGCTHAAFIVASVDALADWLRQQGIRITEGPNIFGHGRRKVCFIRDPDGNAIEFDELLET